MPTLTLLRMQQNNSTNNAVENADVWALARNPVYRRMQQKLIERTAERDTLRAAYLQMVRAIGPDVFDNVPDCFNIRELIAQEQQIQEQLNNI